jgi:predicted DNA-binding mobile mystery protein A
MLRSTLQLARIQLDRRIAPLIGSHLLDRPGEGWLKYIREILGMTQAQLATRLGIKPQSLQRIEKAEADGAVTLKTMRRVAKQLGCRVEYTLIPESGSFVELLRRRAARLAKHQVRDVASSMDLEEQGLSHEELARLRDDLIAQLQRESPSRLWETE